MATYPIQFQIKSNVPVEKLSYQLEVYKDLGSSPKYALPKTPITPFQQGYKTQCYTSLEIDPQKDQHFILAIMIFRNVAGKYISVFDKPKTIVYTLGNPTTNYSISYFETEGTTELETQGSLTIRAISINLKKRAFEDQVYKEGTQADPFSEQRIQQQIQDRLIGYNYPNQAYTSLCGAAAFFYCLLKNQPSIYEQAAWDLWNYGSVQIGDLKIAPSKDCKNPKDISKQFISGLDWMTLASLRDSENIFMDYQVRDPSSNIGFIIEGLAGITPVSTVKSWFKKVGSECVFDNTMLWTPWGLNHAKLKHLLNLNLYAGRLEYNVITLIGAGMLDGTMDRNTGKYPSASKDHWIVWNSKVTLLDGTNITEATPLTEEIKLEAFSWGRVESNYLRDNLTLEIFLGYLFGGFIVTKIC